MNPSIRLCTLASLLLCSASLADDAKKAENKPEGPKPVQALLITGGGYHDYEKQKVILTEGTSSRANIEWTIRMEKDQGKELPLQYKDPDWMKGFDVIVHNECYAAFDDGPTVDKIVAAHTENEVGVVMIHCAMHTFRDAFRNKEAKTTKWYDMIGLFTDRHGPHFPFKVNVVNEAHPIMQGFPKDWVTPKGELYITKAGTCTALATGSKQDATKDEEKDQICIWVNEMGKARVFGTTIGHYNEEMDNDVYLDMMTRGILWSARKLDDKGKPLPGYEVPFKKAEEKAAAPSAAAETK